MSMTGCAISSILGLGQQITRLAASWALGELGAHRIQLEVLARYPDGWKDFILMGVLQSEYAAQAKAPPGAIRSAQQAKGEP